MAKIASKDEINEAYEDVRNDSTKTSWLLLGYDENSIILKETGTDFDEMLNQCCGDDTRCYAYVRVTSGDEMSKRAKFVFITWIGADVSPLKKAKVSIDKATVKSVIQNFAVEVLANERSDIEYDKILELAKKAGGANYGTGQ